MSQVRAELIDCRDWGRPVSFSAVSCPPCGSTEPSGPYVHSKKELRRLRAEDLNDHTLLVTTVACCCGGALFGILLSSITFGAILAGLGYGLLACLSGCLSASRSI
jgi:hypothetical protein